MKAMVAINPKSSTLSIEWDKMFYIPEDSDIMAKVESICSMFVGRINTEETRAQLEHTLNRILQEEIRMNKVSEVNIFGSNAQIVSRQDESTSNWESVI